MANRSEVRVVVWSAASFAALLASYSAFRPVRDALVLDGNPDQIPWLFLATFIAMSVVSPVWSKLLAGRHRRRFVGLALHGFAACAAIFCALVASRVEPIAIGRVFYVWSAVFNLFAVSVFWSLLADLLGPGSARRLYGPIAAGGTVGTIVGPLLTQLLVGTIGVAGILLMSALLLELCVIGVGQVRRSAADAAPGAVEADVLPGGGAFTGIAHVARSRYLSSIVGYVLCTACAATFVYLLQSRIVHDALPGREARTSYLASVELWTNVAVLVLQTVVASPALGRFGPGVVLCVLPIAQAIGISVLALSPSLGSLAAVLIIGRSATHGLTRPSRELLFTVVSRDDKYRAKNAIDTVAYRLGDVSSSWLQQGVLTMFGSGALIAVAIPLAAIWIGLAAILGAGFAKRAAGATGARAAEPTDHAHGTAVATANAIKEPS